MNIILFESDKRDDLLPLCFTRPVSELRTGILRIREKWEYSLPGDYSWKTEDYLQEKYPLRIEKQNLLINAHICPNVELLRAISQLKNGFGIETNGILLAANINSKSVSEFFDDKSVISWSEYKGEVTHIRYPWDLLEVNSKQIQYDFDLLTANRRSGSISSTNQLIHSENIFVEPGAKLEFVTINATAGPVYIGKHAELMEGSFIRGPFVLGDHSVVNMGSKIYGSTTIGPYSKVGGEISQSIITGFSNKGHDGFLGNSVLGEWCNLGAGTNISNLKNNYEEVRVWNYSSKRFVKTGLQFCGLIMGDHSKAGINSMFNTGTVVGVACNIHGAGFMRQFVPSFADGGAGGFKINQLKSVFSTAEKVMARRKEIFTKTDEQILTTVLNRTTKYRRF